MSIRALVDSIETARKNNVNHGASVEGRLNALIAEIEQVKRDFAAEIEERDRDLVRLMEGAA